MDAAARPDDPDRAEPPALDRHSLFEDGQAIVTAVAFVSLGFAFLRYGKLVTGGTAGIALLLARFVPLRFGTIFFLVNVPFFWLGVRQLGWRFTVKTFAAIGLFSVVTDRLDAVVRLEALHPVYGAVMGGALAGTGFLMLFRHGASLGGLSILSIYLQDRHGVRAGAFQLAVDAVIVLASVFVVSPLTLALSAAGAVALNVVLVVNHKPGRYVGT
jgi:uncharacterized membrane-anchored protein YitT (DUF2179 family)